MNFIPDLIPVYVVIIVSFVCSLLLFRLHWKQKKLAALPIAVILLGQGFVYILFTIFDTPIQERAFFIRLGILLIATVLGAMAIILLRFEK